MNLSDHGNSQGIYQRRADRDLEARSLHSRRSLRPDASSGLQAPPAAVGRSDPGDDAAADRTDRTLSVRRLELPAPVRFVRSLNGRACGGFRVFCRKVSGRAAFVVRSRYLCPMSHQIRRAMRIVFLSVILSCAALGAGSSGVVAPDDACSLVAEYAGFSRPSRGRSYAKDAWNVYYRGWKVDGASASSFEDLGGGYGKDAWSVFFDGVKVVAASASSFEGVLPGQKGEGRFRFVVREPRWRLRQRRLDGFLPGRQGAGSLGILVRVSGRRLRQGCVECILHGAQAGGSFSVRVPDAGPKIARR